MTNHRDTIEALLKATPELEALQSAQTRPTDTRLLTALENLVQACEDNVEVPQETYDLIKECR